MLGIRITKVLCVPGKHSTELHPSSWVILPSVLNTHGLDPHSVIGHYPSLIPSHGQNQVTYSEAGMAWMSVVLTDTMVPSEVRRGGHGYVPVF